MLLRGASGLFFAMNLMLAAVFSSHRHFAHTTDHQESALQEDSLDRKHHGPSLHNLGLRLSGILQLISD